MIQLTKANTSKPGIGKPITVRDCILSIIIVSYNTKKVTENCISSIYNSKWRDKFEIIVVDNNSQDGSAQMIKDMFPKVKLIENKENKLFAIANNQGAKIANGKYLLLLNSDTIVESYNLQKMIDYYKTIPEDVICIGPKILNPDRSLQSCGMPEWGSPFQQYATLYGLNKILPLRWLCAPLDKRPNKTHRTGWVSGCCMMIPRDKYLEVGGLNENLFFYGEEPEFGYRTKRLGYKTIYFPHAEIIHLGGVATNKSDENMHSFENDIKQYDCLVSQTVGAKKAIAITKRTIFSLRVKRLFYKNKNFIDYRINHEKKVVKYFQNKLALRHEK